MIMKKNFSNIFVEKVFGFISILVMLWVLICSLYPLIWIFISSFKQTPGGLGLPDVWIFDGYITIFTKLQVQTYFGNSLLISTSSTFISILIVAMSAYVSARMQFKLKNLVTLMFATTLFIPSISISFPIYRLIDTLGLYDKKLGLILVYSGLNIAVSFFIIRGYFLTIPKEMEEAAQMDGCGYVKTFFRIMVPLAKPGLSTAAVLVFLNNWNEFYFATILLLSKANMTIPALLGQFKTVYAQNLNGMFSAIIVSVIPTIILFCCTSELFVKSLTAGAVKG